VLQYIECISDPAETTCDNMYFDHVSTREEGKGRYQYFDIIFSIIILGANVQSVWCSEINWHSFYLHEDDGACMHGFHCVVVFSLPCMPCKRWMKKGQCIAPLLNLWKAPQVKLYKQEGHQCSNERNGVTVILEPITWRVNGDFDFVWVVLKWEPKIVSPNPLGLWTLNALQLNISSMFGCVCVTPCGTCSQYYN
jgi:hypothetical protein